MIHQEPHQRVVSFLQCVALLWLGDLISFVSCFSSVTRPSLLQPSIRSPSIHSSQHYGKLAVSKASSGPFHLSEKSGRSMRLSSADYARTIAQICRSGTLSTISDDGHPLGNSVDFVLDEKGHPIFFFSKAASPLPRDTKASFLCKTPIEYEQTSPLSSKSASFQGRLTPVSESQINSLKIVFSLTHPHCTDSLCNIDDVFFAKLEPSHILYSTGKFGSKPLSIDLKNYENASPDIVAQEIPTLLPKLNVAKQYELRLVCKHIFNIQGDVDTVTLQAIDRLGLDIATIKDSIREDYRVAFRAPIHSAEDAKSELTKLFQECYQREHNKSEFVPKNPPIFEKSIDPLT